MTTFSEALLKDALESEFYLRVRGMTDVLGTRGVVMASFPTPSKWETAPGSGVVLIDGEEYTWYEIFIADKSVRSTSMRGNPKSGIGTPGQQTMMFRLTGDEGDTSQDVWMKVLAQDINRLGLKRAVGVTTVDVDDTEFPVDTTDEFGAAPFYIHAGLECIRVGVKDPTEFQSLTRGRFGSWPVHHGVLEAGKYIEGTGPIVADSMQAMDGRMLDLYMCVGEEVGGAFVPNGAAPASDSDRMIFAGLIASYGLTRDLTRLRIDTADLTHLTNRKLATRLAVATAGTYVGGFNAPDTSRMVIDDTCRFINFTLWRDDSATLTGYTILRFYGVELLQPGTTIPVTPDIYTRTYVEESIATTIIQAQPTMFLDCKVTIAMNSDYKALMLIHLTLVSARSGKFAGASSHPCCCRCSR